LTVVNHHDTTIARAFNYVGYGFEIITKESDNYDLLRQRIVASIDAGTPVLAFGIIGPPECSLICGYDEDGTVLFGWSHFQSRDPADLAANGMFKTSKWYDDLWKIVLCGAPQTTSINVRDIVKHGLAIATASYLGDSDNPGGEEGMYAASSLAYDAWMEYISREVYDNMPNEELRRQYWFHHTMVGSNAEAKAYLGNFLHYHTAGDPELGRIAELYDEIHNLSWRIWEVAGGSNNKEAYLALADSAKRAAIVDLLNQMKLLELQGVDGFTAWLADKE